MTAKELAERIWQISMIDSSTTGTITIPRATELLERAIAEARAEGFSAGTAAVASEINAARVWRDAEKAYESAEGRGATHAAIHAWNAKERAREDYDRVRKAAIRALKDKAND